MVHAMSGSLVEQTGAWASHRADVTPRCVEAFLDLLETSSPDGVSMPAVARRAGISVRTLYRYFPSKDDLRRGRLRLARARIAGRPGRSRARPRRTSASSSATCGETSPRSCPPCASSTAPARGERCASSACRRRAQRGRAGAAGGDHGPRRAELVDLLVAVTSSSMFLELVDRMAYDPEQAADLVADLLETIIATESGRAAGAQKG